MASGSHSTVSDNRHADDVLLEQRVYRIGYQSRKALPIKRNDAEALSREDCQYDLLLQIFENKAAVLYAFPPPDLRVSAHRSQQHTTYSRYFKNHLFRALCLCHLPLE
jgi:hypothetical protein